MSHEEFSNCQGPWYFDISQKLHNKNALYDIADEDVQQKYNLMLFADSIS